MRATSRVFSRFYKNYALGIFTLVCAINVLDRGLIILLLQPIKDDLHLSDGNLGFLTGIAFGLFYATLGVPIGRWADRGNRVTIISSAIGLWGLTVMSCLFVKSFIQLVIARVAAAVGEAGGMPPTYSLIGDYFPTAVERTRAMSIYMLSDPIAVLLSFIVGGWLNTRYGWRMAFFLMGVPAMLVAVLVKLTVREPRQSGRAAVASSLEKRRSLGMTTIVRVLWKQPSSRNLGLGLIFVFLMGVGLSPWYAAFMIRSHGMRTDELGIWMGLIFGAGGIAGVLLGGYSATRWFADNERGQMRLCAMLMASMVPCLAVFLLVPGEVQALLALIPVTVTGSFIFGPTFALMQRLVTDEMRATSLSVVMLLANLIGMGIGPQAVGFLSDAMKPALGDNSLRYAMLIVSCVAWLAALHLWRAGRTVKKDLSDIAISAERSAFDALPVVPVPIAASR
jgi:MFS family permease